MPAYRSGGGGDSSASAGTLYVVINVKMPTTLTKEQKEQLEKILGAPSRDAGAPESSRVAGKLLPQNFEDLKKAKSGEWFSGGGGGGGSSRGSAGGGRGRQSMGGGAPGGVECAQQ